MSDIVQLIRQLVQDELSRRVSSHIGIVAAVAAHADDSDFGNYACDVRLRGREVVLKAVPILTNHLGTVAPPAVGDVVLVEFVESFSEMPVVVGRLYSDQLRPPAYDQGQVLTFLPPGAAEVDRIEIRLNGGKSGSRSLVLKLPDDLVITVSDQKVEAKVGAMSLLIDGKGNKAVLDSGKASVEIASEKLTLKATGDITISADGTVEISAKAGLKLNAAGEAKLTGANVTVDAQGQLKLNAAGPAVMKAAVINLN